MTPWPSGVIVGSTNQTNQMKFPTDIKTITKAAKKAGIVMTSGKGSHVKWTHTDGKTFSFAGHGKETSPGVAKKAWAFINQEYAKAY